MNSLKEYENLIIYLLSHDMKFSTKWNRKISCSTLLLRHDIDFSLSHAYKLAKKELDLGVFSTYFFMFSTNMYNLLSYKNREIVKSIKSMGHKISLHFDPVAYSEIKSFKKEKAIFEKIFDQKVDIVSIHRPGKFLKKNNIKLFGISQTYQDKYFKEMTYISDSGGRDVMPLIKNYLEFKSNKGLHLLIHPIWWCKKSSSPTKTLNDWKKEHIAYIENEIRVNCKTYLD